jgi:regulatory protein
VPVITSIKPQKNKKRVNVYLDGKFGFGIDLENFVKLGLKVEQELSEREIGEIVKKATFQKTLDKLLKFATLRPRSQKEINTWLKRKRVHGSIHKELFNRLNRLDLVDDKGFAQWWIGQRLEFNFKSKRELINELRIKGIKKELIEEILSEAAIDELKIAKKLLQKKSYRWVSLAPLKRKRKMTEFLGRKGFAWETISKAIEILSQK